MVSMIEHQQKQIERLQTALLQKENLLPRRTEPYKSPVKSAVPGHWEEEDNRLDREIDDTVNSEQFIKHQS